METLTRMQSAFDIAIDKNASAFFTGHMRQAADPGWHRLQPVGPYEIRLGLHQANNQTDRFTTLKENPWTPN
jgi:hypothetical protein